MVTVDNTDHILIVSIHAEQQHTKDYLIEQLIKEATKPILSIEGDWSKYGFKKEGDIWMKNPSL